MQYFYGICLTGHLIFCLSSLSQWMIVQYWIVSSVTSTIILHKAFRRFFSSNRFSKVHAVLCVYTQDMYSMAGIWSAMFSLTSNCCLAQPTEKCSTLKSFHLRLATARLIKTLIFCFSELNAWYQLCTSIVKKNVCIEHTYTSVFCTTSYTVHLLMYLYYRMWI